MASSSSLKPMGYLECIEAHVRSALNDNVEDHLVEALDFIQDARRERDEVFADTRELQARVLELQADNTRIENERRHHKARAEAAISLLNAVLVDYPLSEIIGAEQRPAMMARVEEVHAANERLLKDAWCGAANEARAFVKAAEAHALADETPDLAAFVAEWYARFKEVTK